MIRRANPCSATYDTTTKLERQLSARHSRKSGAALTIAEARPWLVSPVIVAVVLRRRPQQDINKGNPSATPYHSPVTHPSLRRRATFPPLPPFPSVANVGANCRTRVADPGASRPAPRNRQGPATDPANISGSMVTNQCHIGPHAGQQRIPLHGQQSILVGHRYFNDTKMPSADQLPGDLAGWLAMRLSEGVTANRLPGDGSPTSTSPHHSPPNDPNCGSRSSVRGTLAMAPLPDAQPTRQFFLVYRIRNCRPTQQTVFGTIQPDGCHPGQDRQAGVAVAVRRSSPRLMSLSRRCSARLVAADTGSIRRYRLLGDWVRGGMGHFLPRRRTETDREVALKVATPRFGGGRRFS